GVPVAAEGQAPIHVVHRAALAGVLCEVGAEGRYGALDLGPLPDRAEALAELARRYAAAHAPCGAEDFATWSGLPAADVRAAWDGEPRIEGEAKEGPVRLLGAFDEWLLG
ncbi:MAG TPA: crosslink repair DNA glycosylase YcaQ family protein, partial [Solirubrobacteraceae bacterium]